MMAWPRTEKVGEGTLGLGRGWMDCLSRKWASYLDLVWMDMMGFEMAGMHCILTSGKLSQVPKNKRKQNGLYGKNRRNDTQATALQLACKASCTDKRRQADVKQVDEFK